MVDSNSERVVSPCAAERVGTAIRWLIDRGCDREVLVVGASLGAAQELLHHATRRVGAAFGWYRTSLPLLAAELAAPDSAAIPIGSLGLAALGARAAHRLSEAGQLGRYASVAAAPGFTPALARNLSEMRRARVDRRSLESVDPDLAGLLERYAREMEAAGTCDDAAQRMAAVERLQDGRADGHPWVGIPVLFLDVPAVDRVDRDLIDAVLDRAPSALWTIPAGEPRRTDEPTSAVNATNALTRLQHHLFEDAGVTESELDAGVTLFSAPGEGRECVEIVRAVLGRAADGVRFDQMAVLLRSPVEYRAHLTEALERAGIPAWVERGARRPDPAGRAFLALLRCRLNEYSAQTFAEYLSIGQVPRSTGDGEPPRASGDPGRIEALDADDPGWPERLDIATAEWGAGGIGESSGMPEVDDVRPGPTDPVTGGSLRVPRQWEKLLVEAAVVGGIERWRARLSGLEAEYRRRHDALRDEDDVDTAWLDDQLRALGHLRSFALPLLEQMSIWSPEAPWGTWRERLTELAGRALRDPARVRTVLAALAPLDPVGPVRLDEVVRVLDRHLLEVTDAPEGRRWGKLFVGTVDSARGRTFDTVFVPGLADHLFPRALDQEPLLSDEKRRVVCQDRADVELRTTPDRVAAEQALLRIAVGAATERVVLSYPRMDLARSRPRVPSFYTLEAIRAAAGRLPLLEELRTRADQVTHARVGWPAPEDPALAIDTAEYDLAMLRALLRKTATEQGAAHYLLNVNPFLRRQLQSRLRRWHTSWTWADGYYDPGATARSAMDAHRPSARSYSATAIQALALCPYRFFLYAVRGLRSREVARPIDRLDPLARGSLVHEVQFRTGRRLASEEMLPLGPENLAGALEVLDEELDTVAAEYEADLAPAIPRVWADEIARLRADLRRWLRESAADQAWTPWRFEFAFGLGRAGRDGSEQDPDSRPEAVPIEGGLSLRGKIDLVERRVGADRIRITDHKTGRARLAYRKGQVVIDGGETLQPVLYALAAEAVWPERTIEGGGLFYCTSDGGFQRVDVPLDRAAREAAATVGDALAASVDRAELVARPREFRPGLTACAYCDFRPICGPHEGIRTARKPKLEWLERLRAQP